MTEINGFDLIIEPDEEEPEAAEVCVEVTLGTEKYRFLLDTGAARTSVVLDDYTRSFESLGTSNSSGVFASITDDLVTLPGFSLGPISREDLTVLRVRGDNPGVRNLVGMDVLKDYCCQFLFDEERVQLHPDAV